MSELTADVPRRPSRLEPAKESSVAPFFRSDQLQDVSVYWLPVSGFPLAWRERHWLLTFLNRLRDLLAKDDFKIESFLQFKGLNRDNTDLFLSRKLQYTPLGGIALRPGAAMPASPSNEAVRREIEDNAYNVDVAQWMPDFCHWLLTGSDEEQRFDFFGTGHMSFLFAPPDEASPAPKLFMPRIMRTHPAMQENKLQEQMNVASAMKRPFLKRSKELFGAGIRDHHAYEGIPFVMPILTSADLIGTIAETRAEWFQLFGAYFAESPSDRGCLLAVKDSEFDERLSGILQQMRSEGHVYPQ